MAKPWERQSTDTPKSFAAFELYLAQEPKTRSLRQVAATCGKSETLIGRWSKAHKWPERVLAFDTHVASEDARKLAEQRVKEREEMRERNRVIGRAAMAKVAKALSREEGKGEIQIESAVDLYRVAKTATMLEQIGHDIGGPVGRAASSGDNAGTTDDDLPKINRLEVVVITDGGKIISGEELAAKMHSFYDDIERKP